MKKILYMLIVFALFSCKNEAKKAALKVVEGSESIPQNETETNEELRYINAPSGLNYRDKPKGKSLGKFEHNQKITIVERTEVFSEITDDGDKVKGEWVGISLEKDTVYVFDGYLAAAKVVDRVWSKFPLREMPLVDSTGFDNYSRKNRLTRKEIKQLQLQDLYPKLLVYGSYYEAYPSYQLNLANAKKSIVVTILKGQHEMESVLIIYNEEDKLIKFHSDNNYDKPVVNALVISYDEIAEGWSRTTSTIQNKCITTTDGLYTDTPKIDTLLHHVNLDGYINKVNTKFKNNIRYKKPIKLHTVYTDTIKFLKYNDNYDYFFIEGKKNNREVSLIYNWEVSDKTDFKKNDLIKVTWKMDSISIAGDGETLDFQEWAIDAEKVNP